MRRLHIGPGADRLEGFETLDIAPGRFIDYVADARQLPFPDNSFDLLYASHVIEHIPWYETAALLREWYRVIASGGALEVWTVDAKKVAQLLLEAESGTPWFNPDGWKRFNKEDNPYLWCAGRLLSYTKPGEFGRFNEHKALFTPKYLEACFRAAGFDRVERLQKPRGKDHGFCNLGVIGVKSSDSRQCREQEPSLQRQAIPPAPDCSQPSISRRFL